jgi:hypothetical protein
MYSFVLADVSLNLGPSPVNPEALLAGADAMWTGRPMELDGGVHTMGASPSKDRDEIYLYDL